MKIRENSKTGTRNKNLKGNLFEVLVNESR